ncbi:hypothetical protein J4444_03655 [Candidatus Woesearchaeota archaeon]|nr:hypothetical protein [Candidatus Woesearchaeota archaeon]
MALRIPESMNECLYFTNRDTVLAWVYRKTCPKCKKAKMGKPVVKGKVKTRAEVYECPACKYQEDKIAHEESLELESAYTCPKCKKKGESTGQYKRKAYKGVQSYIVTCQHCGEVIPLTKKLKGIKGKVAEEDVDDE